MQAMQEKEPMGIHCILAMIYFLAVPLTITVNSAGDSFLKLLTLPIGAFFLVTLFFYKDKLELNSVHTFLALFIISVVATLFVDGSAVSVDYVMGYIQNAGLMFCITLRKYNSREIKWLENAQIVLLGIMIYLGLFEGTTYADRTTIEIFGGTSDPNYFCGFFVFPIAVCMKYIIKNSYRWICLPLVLLGIYTVILSGSRGGLLAVIATIAASVVVYSKDFVRLIIAMAALVAAAVVFWTVILPILPENIAARMSVEAVIESRGTSRVDIWLSMLQTIKESTWELFLGRGIDAHHTMLIGGTEQDVVAHNNFIQTLYNQGIIGLLLFVGLSASAILRNIRKRGYIAAGMIGILTLAMSLTLNPSIKPFWNLVMYAGLSFTLNPAAGKGVEVKNEAADKRSRERGKTFTDGDRHGWRREDLINGKRQGR